MSRDRAIVLGAVILGAGCALAALVPTESYAQAFAHPARVARIGGGVPEATLQGALWLRIALAAAAAAIPALAFAIVRMLETAGADHAAQCEPASRGETVLLAAIAAAGLVLRIALASESLWYDEISAFVSFAIEGPGVAFGSYAVPTNHVPMTLAMWGMATLTGSVDELVLRLPAVVAGMVAIAAAWALVREIAPAPMAERAGLCAALVAAIAPIPVIESAEARGYAFVIAAALVAALALARLARTRAATDALLLAVACAFAAWSHPVAVVLTGAVGFVGAVQLCDAWRKPGRTACASAGATLLAALLAGAIAAPLLAPLAADALAHRADYMQRAAGETGYIPSEGRETLVGLSLSWSLGLPTAPWASLTALLPGRLLPPAMLVALVAAGAWRISRDRALSRARAVASPFLVAYFAAMALGAIIGTWSYARFFLFVLPAPLLAISIALAAPAGRWTRGALVGAFVLQCAVALPVYWRKQPIRNAVEAVAAMRADDDIVLAVGLPDNAVGFYAALSGFEAVPTGFLGADLEKVAASSPRPPRFVVALYPERLDAGVLAALDARFDRTHRFEGWADWGHGAVEVWERTGRSGTNPAGGPS